jgi:hypothetical protein
MAPKQKPAKVRPDLAENAFLTHYLLGGPV